ncbi:MAG: hypothetical protein GW949_09890 [Spirochaetales bacterium]|nr:hypothetical protein [Spirochaetales bacterium]
MAKNLSLAVSASSDGSILLWSTDVPTLQSRITVPHRTISELIIRPDGSSFAYLTPSGGGRFTLWSYSLQNREELFSKTIDSQPLSFSYSPNGSSIILTFANLSSVTLLSSTTGRQQRGLSQAFGIVNFGFMSQSGSSYMGYQSSRGLITYHRVQSSEELARVQTLRDIRKLELQSNKRIGVGRVNDDLVLLDVVSGQELFRHTFPQIYDFFLINDQTLGVVTSTGNRYSIQWLSMTPRALTPLRNEPSLRLPNSNGVFSGVPNSGVAGTTEGGGIFLVSFETNSLLAASIQRIVPISTIVRGSNFVVTASSRGITYFDETEAFQLLNASSRASSFQSKPLNIPFQGVPDIVSLTENKILIWNSTGAGRLWIADFSQGPDPSLRAVGDTRTKPIVRVRVQDDYVILFYSDDSLEVLDSLNFSRIQEYTSLGIQDAIVFNNESLVIAQTSEGSLNSSLIRVNLQTLETTSLAQDDRLVYRLAHIDNTLEFFTLGISFPSQGQRTNLRKYTWTGPNRPGFSASLVSSIASEDIHAGMTTHGQMVLTSLGGEQASMYDGRRFTTLSSSRRIPRRMISLRDTIGSINSDGTASFWNPDNRSFLAEAVLMETGELLMIGRNLNLLVLSNRELVLDAQGVASRFLIDPSQLRTLNFTKSDTEIDAVPDGE